jgi:integrase
VSVYRDGDTWRYRKVVRIGDERVRISGTPDVNTKLHAERAEREHIERVISTATIARHAPESLVEKPPVPTFTEFFEGRYWTEYAIGEKENREGTRNEKRAIFERHLKPALGDMPMDQLDIGAVNRLRAELKDKVGRTGKPLSDKTRANILNVLSNVLRYAVESETIGHAPRVKVKKPARPEIETWTFEEYGRALGAALELGDDWGMAYLLAGDCGLRIGEILALESRDCDLVAGTLTVARQVRRGIEGVPKGGKPRAVPMTARLIARCRELKRDGKLVRLSEGDAKHGVYDVCRRAGLPLRSWHCARHAFATHAALLGVNPLRLQRWLGHATLDMTLRYVHFVDDHPWPIPDVVLMSGSEILHPDRRITAQLGARAAIAPASCQTGAKEKRGSDKLSKPRLFSVAGAGFEPVSED